MYAPCFLPSHIALAYQNACGFKPENQSKEVNLRSSEHLKQRYMLEHSSEKHVLVHTDFETTCVLFQVEQAAPCQPFLQVKSGMIAAGRVLLLGCSTRDLCEVYSAINPKPQLLMFLDFFTLRHFLLETSLMKGGRLRRYSFVYLMPVNALHGRIQGTKCGLRRSCLISPGEKAGMVLPARPGKERRWFRNRCGQARAFLMNVLACTAVLNARSSGGLLPCSGSLV